MIELLPEHSLWSLASRLNRLFCPFQVQNVYQIHRAWLSRGYGRLGTSILDVARRGMVSAYSNQQVESQTHFEYDQNALALRLDRLFCLFQRQNISQIHHPWISCGYGRVSTPGFDFATWCIHILKVDKSSLVRQRSKNDLALCLDQLFCPFQGQDA